MFPDGKQHPLLAETQHDREELTRSRPLGLPGLMFLNASHVLIKHARINVLSMAALLFELDIHANNVLG